MTTRPPEIISRLHLAFFSTRSLGGVDRPGAAHSGPGVWCDDAGSTRALGVVDRPRAARLGPGECCDDAKPISSSSSLACSVSVPRGTMPIISFAKRSAAASASRVQVKLELDLAEHLRECFCRRILLAAGAPICSGRSGCGGGIATTHAGPQAIALCQHPELHFARQDDCHESHSFRTRW